MKTNDLRNRLKDMQFRVRAVHGLVGAQHDSAELDAFFDDLVNPKDEDGKPLAGEALQKRERETCEMMVEAWGDKEKMKELCAVRVQTESNYIRATSDLTELMYEVVTLADDERPALQNETMQEIDVGYLSQDGKPRLTKALAQQEEQLIPLQVLSTDYFGYFTRDIYNGNVAPAALRTVDIAFDARNKYDQKGFLLLTASRANGGCYGAFDITNAKRTSRDFVANSRINLDNLPETNEIVLTGNTAAGGIFRVLEVIEATMNYCDAWGDSFSDGKLAPTGIIKVPSSELNGITKQIKPTGSTSNPVANQVMQKYTSFEYLGILWVLMPDATLAPGKCYPILNKKVGIAYLKPSQDREIVKTDDENDYEKRMMKKVVGYVIPSNRRLRALRIDYSTAS